MDNDLDKYIRALEQFCEEITDVSDAKRAGRASRTLNISTETEINIEKFVYYSETVEVAGPDGVGNGQDLISSTSSPHVFESGERSDSAPVTLPSSASSLSESARFIPITELTMAAPEV